MMDKFSEVCARCGANRLAILYNIARGDPLAQYLLSGCPDCAKLLAAWELKQIGIASEAR